MTHLIPAGLAHAAVLEALHAEAFPPGERWSSEAIAGQLGMANSFGLIAISAQALPCGLVLARVAADEAEILTLGVNPAQRQQGVARRLLAAAEARAMELGANAMFLEVAEPNVQARALYARHTYQEVGRRLRYYASGADALVLRRDLQGQQAVLF